LLTSLTGGNGGPEETLGDVQAELLGESYNEEDDGADEDAGVLDLAELVHKASFLTL
jgi:hypothetical protein